MPWSARPPRTVAGSMWKSTEYPSGMMPDFYISLGIGTSAIVSAPFSSRTNLNIVFFDSRKSHFDDIRRNQALSGEFGRHCWYWSLSKGLWGCVNATTEKTTTLVYSHSSAINPCEGPWEVCKNVQLANAVSLFKAFVIRFDSNEWELCKRQSTCLVVTVLFDPRSFFLCRSLASANLT